MDEIGGYVDPLRLVRRIPDGLAIPRLRDRLVHIIADFRTQTSLRQGCAAILEHDCLALAQVRLQATAGPAVIGHSGCPWEARLQVGGLRAVAERRLSLCAGSACTRRFGERCGPFT